MPLRHTAAASVLLSLIVCAVQASGRPSLRAVFRAAPPAIAVTASDPAGLDAVELSCPALDLSYTTQLSRAAVDRRFERVFVLREIFPDLSASPGPVRVIVTVRNTRGASASVSVAVRSDSSGKHH